MAYTDYLDTVQKIYIGYYGRAADPIGQEYWARQLDTHGGSLTTIIDAFGNSAEATTLFSGMSNAAKVNAIYRQCFGRDAEVAGLTYYANALTVGTYTQASIMLNVLNGATGTDATAVANKLAAAKLYTAALDTTAEILAYSGTTAAASARTFLATVTDTAASLTTATAAVTTSVASMVTGASAAAGQTYTLTTNIDTITGTNGNDTFIGDAASTSVADQISGGDGTDTLKLYGTAVKSVISNIEKIYLSVPGANFDVSGMTGVTSLEVDANAAAFTYTVTTGQDLKFDNFLTNAVTTTVAGNTPASLNVTLDKFGTAALVNTLDFSGTALTTANFITANNASTLTLTDTGAKLNKLTVAGDKGLTITENAATSAAIKTIDASTATGAVSVDTTAGAKATTFAFTGGSGNDTIKLAPGDLALLTAGSQLAGGAGTGDKIVTLDVTFTAADYAKLNATTGFEVLGTGAAVAAVDASQLTSIKSFSIDGNAAQVYSNMATGSSATVTATHAANLSFAGAVGVNDLSLAIGAATTAGLAVGGNLTIGQTVVALSSNGTNAAANTITNLLNADNSVYTVTGSNDLTIGTMRATAIGTKIDATALTGKLNVTGNATAFLTGSSLGDVLIGGSGADTIKAAINGGILTGNGGADNFDVSVALGGVTATYQTTTITDFTKADKITFGGTAGAFTAAKVDLSGAASVGAALDLLAAGNNSDLKWGNYGGNTYIVDDVAAGATFAAADTMVKLTGTLDLSTSSLAAAVLTYA